MRMYIENQTHVYTRCEPRVNQGEKTQNIVEFLVGNQKVGKDLKLFQHFECTNIYK